MMGHARISWGDEVPKGRLNLAQDVVLGLPTNMIKSRRDG